MPNKVIQSHKVKSTSSLNIAIAGAGLMGSLAAWRLINLGHKVTIFEKGSLSKPTSAAYTAAAMISPMSEVVVSERSIYDLGITSLKLWPQWIKELEEQSGQSVHYRSDGSLLVAHSADSAELEQFYQDLCFHLGNDNSAQWVQKKQLQQLEPSLSSQFEQALLLPGEAHLDNRALLSNLMEAFIRAGGTIEENTPIEFKPEPLTNGQPLEGYELILDCRGVGAKASNTWMPSPIRGVRGEVLWVQTSEIKLHRPVRLMHPRYKLYVVPKPNNQFIIGATEIESQDMSPVSVQSSLELCSALYTLNPAFSEARIIESDVNLRPSYLDNLPSIDDEWVGQNKQQKVIRINGLYRHGYLLAPALIEQVLARL